MARLGRSIPRRFPAAYVATSDGTSIITPAGIPSAEAFGTLTLTAVVEPGGIGSGEAFGAASLAAVVQPGGIGSGEAFGTATVSVTGVIGPAAIPSAEAFGAPTLVYDQTLTATGIASAEAFGTALLVAVVAPGGIPSAEAFGIPLLVAVVQPAGIASGQAFGTATLVPGQVVITATGIPSAESVGTPSLLVVVDPALLVSRPQMRHTAYELVCVARIPQSAGPPTLIEVDPIEWSGLAWTEELSQPQRLDASARIATLTEPVIQRLRAMATLPCELWLYRDGRLVFAGPWVGALAQGETLTLRAVGLLGYLRYRELRADAVFSQVDQHDIVKSLVDTTQARPYGHFGIDTSGATPSGVLRDARYLFTERHNVGQRIEELGKRANGFDIEIDPGTRQVQLWSPTKGADRSSGEDAVVFDARNVTDTTVTFSVAPGDIATDTLAIGTSDRDTVTGTAGNDELRSKFGVADYTESFDGVSELATAADHAASILDARDQALLIPGPGVRSAPDADLASYTVGDTVAYQVHDVLGVRGAFRVRKRTVSVSETGEEKISLEFA